MPESANLDIILYSREQLVKEYRDMPTKGSGEVIVVWYCVCMYSIGGGVQGFGAVSGVRAHGSHACDPFL